MRVTIIGSESISVIDLAKLIPAETTELIISGSTLFSRLVQECADRNAIPRLLIQRSEVAVSISDLIIAVWNGRSSEIMKAIRCACRIGKPVDIHMLEKIRLYSVIALWN